MTRNEEHDHWAGRKKLWIWFSQPDAAELKLAEMMVYAYRVYQDEYGGTPSVLKVCRATGLSKQAVTHADHRLIALGLLDSGRTVQQPPAGWFQTKRAESIAALGGRHWRHHYVHWELLVRDPKTAQHRMTHLQAVLISFLWHCRKTNFEPRNGWSVAYLSKVLRCKWESARDGLLVLEHLGFLRHELGQQGNMRLSLYKPSQEHLALFQRSEQPKTFNRNDCTIGVEEARESPLPSVTKAICLRYTFADVLKAVERATGYRGEEAEDLAWKLVEKTDDVEQICLDLHGLAFRPLYRRQAALERMVLEDDVAENIAA